MPDLNTKQDDSFWRIHVTFRPNGRSYPVNGHPTSVGTEVLVKMESSGALIRATVARIERASKPCKNSIVCYGEMIARYGRGPVDVVDSCTLATFLSSLRWKIVSTSPSTQFHAEKDLNVEASNIWQKAWVLENNGPDRLSFPLRKTLLFSENKKSPLAKYRIGWQKLNSGILELNNRSIDRSSFTDERNPWKAAAEWAED
ncbi:hypothetical protein ACLBKT_15370 [Erythrobacter sp. W302b]|uniref:hypothetical protein n=1 Tax=Erythrobacter sp. W302b TaxID=3389874 RepID=UPI00396B4783